MLGRRPLAASTRQQIWATWPHEAHRCGMLVSAVRRMQELNERIDVRIHDEDALAEIELTSDLMIAASEQDTALTQEQVDAILGLRRG